MSPGEAALEGVREGLTLLGPDWRILNLNQVAASQFGWERKNLLGGILLELFPDVEKMDLFKRLHAAMADRRPCAFEAEVPEADGTRRWYDLHAVPHPRGLLVSCMDITGRKAAEDAQHRAEEELAARERTFRSLLDSLEVAFSYSEFIYSPDGVPYDLRWLDVNAHFLKALGKEREEIIGRPHGEVLPHSDPWWLDMFLEVARRKQPLRFEQHVQVNDRQYEFFVYSPSHMKIALFQPDITEQRKAQKAIQDLNEALTARAAQLEEAVKELDSFTYSVSHDLRAPLRHILAFSDLLRGQHGADLSAKGQHYLETIQKSARNLGELIDHLLDLARDSRKEINWKNVPMSTVVASVIAALEPETLGREVAWKIGPLPLVHADPVLLRDVITNLITNALKFTAPREQAVIEMGCQEEGSEITFFIRDNGVGFNPAYSHKLFAIFQRLHDPQKFPGTGVGLANVQRIIQRHGGRIWAEGHVGAGATFWFTLPASRP